VAKRKRTPKNIVITERIAGKEEKRTLSPYQSKLVRALFSGTPAQKRKIPSSVIEHHVLLENLKHNMPLLEEKLAEYSEEWPFEDPFYRAHYGSNKVYQVQNSTQDIVETLRSLSPILRQPLGDYMQKIYEQGTGKEFHASHNQDWIGHAMPLVTAFLHARTFLELAVKYGKELKTAPAILPSGWAAILCFYNMR
jgi:hypothetical protein